MRSKVVPSVVTPLSVIVTSSAAVQSVIRQSSKLDKGVSGSAV